MRSVALIVGWCLVALPICADPVNYTITNLTAADTGGGPLVNFGGSGFSASGDPISISGSWGTARAGPVFPNAPGGGAWMFDLDCGPPAINCSEGGVATVGGKQFGVQLLNVGMVLVSGSTSVTFEASTPTILTYIVPAMAAGEFTAVCFRNPNCVDGTLIGNVFIDLPGEETITFQSLGFAEYQFLSATFVSTPEASSVALVLVGLAISGVAAIWRRRRKVRCASVLC